jgi:hypothetical protein
VNVEQHAIGILMAELGPAADLAAVAEYEGDGGWGLMVDDDTIVDAEIDPVNAVLVLSADVCPLPEGRALHWCRLLLNFNDQWLDSGGFRMSLAAAGGMVSQTLVLPLSGLELGALQERLERFLVVLNAWRAILRDGAASAEPEMALDRLLGAMIRG